MLLAAVLLPAFSAPEQPVAVVILQGDIQVVTSDMSGHGILLRDTLPVASREHTIIIRTPRVDVRDILLGKTSVRPKIRILAGFESNCPGRLRRELAASL